MHFVTLMHINSYVRPFIFMHLNVALQFGPSSRVLSRVFLVRHVGLLQILF